jgi:selenoprotein W-related protein
MKKPRIEIIYCRQCNWLLRAAWVAQEVLSTFSEEIGEVCLIPGTGGIFEIKLDKNQLFSRKEMGRFPEMKEIKSRIRDLVDPDRDLGHIDRKNRS